MLAIQLFAADSCQSDFLLLPYRLSTGCIEALKKLLGGAEVALEILGRLVEYTRIHFTVEESLIRVPGYPDYEERKEHHTQLIDQVNNLHEKVIQGNRSALSYFIF